MSSVNIGNCGNSWSSRRGVALIAGIILVFGGCYGPSFVEGLECSAEGLCPEGQVCGGDGKCYRQGNECTMTAEFVQELTTSNMASAQFGLSAELSGTTLAFGVPTSTNVAADDGAVYTFQLSGALWTESAPISPLDAVTLKYFGNDVDIEGNLMVVGNQFDPALALDGGSVYIFELDGATWQQVQRIEPEVTIEAGFYGASVATDGSTVVITSEGTDEVFIHENAGGVWQPSTTLPVVGLINGEIALSSDTLLIGAPDNPTLGPVAGAAQVYERISGQWQQSALLLADDGAPNDYLGWSVALQGDLAVIGAPADSHEGGDFAGSVYVFERSDAGWNQVAKLTADDAQSTDNFGISVAIAGDTIVVGSMLDDDLGTDTGSVYVFKQAGSQWRQVLKIQPQRSQPEAWFGYAVAIDGTMVIAGSPYYGAGSAFIYDVDCR